MSESVENKTTRLVVSDSASESTDFAPPSSKSPLGDSRDAPQPCAVKTEAPVFARVGGVDFSDRSHVEAVIKDLPMDEFLRLVEGASPEELQSLLIAADTPALAKRPTSNPFGMLFDPLEYKQLDVLKIIGWWESRRIFYNVVVGVCGLFTLGFLQLVYLTQFFQFLHASAFAPMIASVLFVAFVANVCYTIGWVCDVFARYFWKEKAEHFGPILYSLGLIFSVLVVLSPIALVCLMAVF